MRTTPIKIMEDTIAIQPLSKRKDMRIMIQAERYKRSHSHPMKTKMHDIAKKTNKTCKLHTQDQHTLKDLRKQ